MSMVMVNGVLEMHDLLQEMGRSIVMQECPNDVGKRNRLWALDEIDQVLRRNMGTEEIQCIVLKLPEPYEAQWNPTAFSKMQNLRLLILSNLQLPLGLECLSGALKILEWVGFPLEALPLGIQLDELIDLKIRHSKIIEPWDEKQFLGKLKFMDMSYSKELIRTPDFFGVPNLERLILEACINLTEVHPSLGLHKKLVIVNLKDCTNLKTLPKKLEMDSLQDLILSGCSKLKKVSQFGEKMENLNKLDLEGTSIIKLPPSIGYLNSLAVLNLRDCKSLVCLPKTISKLKSLKILNIFACSKFSRLPENLNQNVSLEELDVSGTAIKVVPLSINHLKNLQILSFAKCQGLVSSSNLQQLFLPLEWMVPLKSTLSHLRKLDLSFCNLCDGSIPDDLSCLASLESLNLSGNKFINLPTDCISNLQRLNSLWLSSCPMLQSLPKLPPYVSFVRAGDCASMNPLSNSQQLWDVFAPLNLQQRSAQSTIGCSPYANGNVFLNIPGSEIPSWFENQNYVFQDELLRYFYGADSIATINVAIPKVWPSSEWLGIAICLAIENLIPSPLWRYSVHWYSKDVRADESSMVVGLKIDAEYDCPHLCIFFLRFCNDNNCSHHLRSKSDQVQLIFYTQKRPKTKKAFNYFEEIFSEKVKIRKCGWRLLCNEDVDVWRRTMSVCNQLAGHGSNKRRRQEMEE